MKTTAERLREIMNARNLKQADVIELAKPFADKYGAKLTRPDMSQYCAGKVVPTQQKLFLLAAALDVNEAWLMGYDVTPNRNTGFLVETEDSIMYETAKNHSIEQWLGLKETGFDHTLTDRERDIIAAYRHADDRTRRMIAYMLKLEDLTDADR